MTDQHPITVLVADDDALYQELIRHRLESRGMTVIQALDGDAALRQLADGLRPDAIVLDVMMPGADGFEVLRRLKEAPETKAIPVIMLTGRRSEDDVIKGLSAGAADYLVKPFIPDELVLRIRRLAGPAE